MLQTFLLGQRVRSLLWLSVSPQWWRCASVQHRGIRFRPLNTLTHCACHKFLAQDSSFWESFDGRSSLEQRKGGRTWPSFDAWTSAVRHQTACAFCYLGLNMLKVRRHRGTAKRNQSHDLNASFETRLFWVSSLRACYPNRAGSSSLCLKLIPTLGTIWTLS